MSLYRVVISFMREHMQYMSERGVIAMTPGQALDDTLRHLQIDQSRIESLKTLIWKPEKLDDFSYDAQNLICLNTSYTVKDYWFRKYEHKTSKASQ